MTAPTTIAAKLATDSDALTAYARELAQGTVDVMGADDHSDYLADPAGWEDGLSMQLGEAFTQDKIADESLQEEIQREYLSLITEILEAQTAAPTKDRPMTISSTIAADSATARIVVDEMTGDERQALIILDEDALNAFLDGSETEDREDEIRDCLIATYEEMGFEVDFRRRVSGTPSDDDSRADDWNRALALVSEKMGL